MQQSLTQLKKDSECQVLPRASDGAGSRDGPVVSTGIALISLRTNVFGRPWGGEQSQGWRDMGGGRRGLWGLSFGWAFICIPLSSVTVWESQREVAATHSRELRLTALQQRFRDQRGDKSPTITPWPPRQAAVELPNKLGDVDGFQNG